MLCTCRCCLCHQCCQGVRAQFGDSQQGPNNSGSDDDSDPPGLESFMRFATLSIAYVAS